MNMFATLPPLSNVPYRRNQFFTGREDVLKRLYDALQADNLVALSHPQGISGLGGIGKTQTALEYAYRYAADYTAVFWVRAHSLATLTSSFGEIAQILDLPEKDKQDQRIIVAAVQRWFLHHSGWLLIFDNMDDFSLAAPFLPKTGPGHSIFTTRAHALGEIAQPLEVLPMDPETGALLLLYRSSLLAMHALLDQASSDQSRLACQISQELDGLPLALDQAGAYVKETPCTLAEYLRLYQQRRHDLLQIRGTDSADYTASVATTWSLSFEKVAQANLASSELLNLCAFLAPDAIPPTIFIRGAPHLGNILAPVAAHPLQFDSACKEALRFSLVARERETQTLTMHRLVQAILRANIPVESQQHWRFIPSVFGKQNTVATQKDWMQRAILAVNAASPKVQEVAEWDDCEVWVPHALACADWIEQEKLFHQESTDLLNQAGYYLDTRARYTEAETVYRDNLSIYEQQFEPTHPYIAQALNNLASTYNHQGKYAAAEPLLRRALAIVEQQLQGQQPSSKTRLNNLSKVYDDQKAREENSEFRRWLVTREQDLETALNNLAATCHSLGKHAEAEALYQRARAIQQQHSGMESAEEAQTLSNLATLYIEQEKYEEAEQLLKQALAIQQRQLETMHPITAVILNTLGELYAFQGNAQEAEPLLRQALEIRKKVLGVTHPDTAISFDNLAVLYYE